MRDRSRFPLDDMPIASLRIFCAVVEAEGFSAAARQLKLSVSAVSKAVANLERATNTALLFRTTRRVKITEAGRKFHQKFQKILHDIDHAASMDPDGVRGRLRISAPPSVASELLSPHMPAFFDENPLISVDFFVTSALPDIVRNRIDIAIVLREWPEVKMTHRLIAKLDRVLCTSPRYIERHGAPQRVADLADRACLASLISGTAEQWILYEEDKKHAINANAIMSSDNGDVLRRACIDGFGIANLYKFHAQRFLDSGELVHALPGVMQLPVGLFAVMPHKSMISASSLKFAEFLDSIVFKHAF